MRILYCPLRSPTRASKWLTGNAARSRSDPAASIRSNFSRAHRSNPENALTRFPAATSGPLIRIADDHTCQTLLVANLELLPLNWKTCMQETVFERVDHCARCSKLIVISASVTETISCPRCGHNWPHEIPGQLLQIEKRIDPDQRLNRPWGVLQLCFEVERDAI